MRTLIDRRAPSRRPALLHRYGLTALLVLAAVPVLAACGGGGDESSTPARPTSAETPAATPAQTPPATAEPTEEGGQVLAGEVDPCALLTKEEVEAALGASVSDPTLEVIDPFATCYFNDPETPIYHTVSVSVFTLGDGDQTRDAFEMGREGSETVTGIGDDAYWTAEPFNSLEILKGKYDISIDVSPNGWDALAVAKELAVKVLGRMP